MPEFRDVIPGSQVSASQPSLAGLQAAMAAGPLSSAALTGFYLQRIDRLNPALHAVITVNLDAPAEAAASDAARAAGGPRGPLEGVPVLVKDNVQVAGMPTTAGSPALLTAEPGDAFLVSRLRAAGAVIIGKANLSEWANFRSTHSTSGWSTLGGQTANPYALDRNPSGSRSGSAAGVAAGLAPVAVGTETDGSIVCPASACGIVGIKPTNGLVSRRGIVPISPVQDTAGPMGTCVADAAALLSVLAAADPEDPVSETENEWAERAGFELSAATFSRALDGAALEGARLGVWREGSAASGPATAAVLEEAVARLRSLGAVVTDPVSLPDADEITEPEFAALRYEFKYGSTRTWPTSRSSARAGRCRAPWPNSSTSTSATRTWCSPGSARRYSSRPRRQAATLPTATTCPCGGTPPVSPAPRSPPRWSSTGSKPSWR